LINVTTQEIIQRSWRETPQIHRNRLNLLIHLICVPLFICAHVLVVLSVITGSLSGLFMGLVSIASSVVSQQFGHSLEQESTPPASNTYDIFVGFYAEQLLNFWRFLFSGQLFKNLLRST